MKRWLIIGSLFLALGCSDPFIELPVGNGTIVVEGWMSDQDTQHWVKVSESIRFNDTRPEIVIDDATVLIEDDQANVYPLTYDDSSGRYLTASFPGVVGNAYRVVITLQNGTEITSSWETLLNVPPINSVLFDSFDDTDPITGEPILVYYPVVTSIDPNNEQNQYRYKGYKNGQLFNAPEELILLSDEFNNGQLLPHHIPEFRLALNDQITIELHSLSKPAFQFLELLRVQTTSFGSSSGTAPAKLIGNLSYTNQPNEIVLGFFGASAIKTSTAQVTE
jgi:hypothetical protein